MTNEQVAIKLDCHQRTFHSFCGDLENINYEYLKYLHVFSPGISLVTGNIYSYVLQWITLIVVKKEAATLEKLISSMVIKDTFSL